MDTQPWDKSMSINTHFSSIIQKDLKQKIKKKKKHFEESEFVNEGPD